MIILDTNVISEILRAKPSSKVTDWLGAQPRGAMFVTTVTQAEILYGLSLLPAGKRHDDLVAAVRPVFDEDFAGRILSFDSDAATAYAEIASHRRHLGQPITQDAQIAAIARSRGGTLATRNVRDFNDCGIDVVDPWKATSSRS
jgi:predicted nucleic acid-binding protein